mmetsp:Transcript_14060/g.44734  ORF Transcript_14060/g.44734 Transcript_14060/m.44734 type:complete len:214 (+) Transcript_14060:593-1234(+)
MISDITLGSRPLSMPICKASDVPAMRIAKSILLHILATCPAPTSPAWKMFFPIAFKKPSALSKSNLSPPTIKVSVPAAAPATPPDTGASIKRCPNSLSLFPILIAALDSIVLQSMNKALADILFTMPSSPKYRDSTCLSAGSIEITTSALETASATLLLGLAPASANNCTCDSTRSKTVVLNPALTRFLAIDAPMLPRPKNAILDMLNSISFF